MSIEGRKEALEARHAKLEATIEKMVVRPYYSDLEMAELKKQKLAIKDELEALS